MLVMVSEMRGTQPETQTQMPHMQLDLPQMQIQPVMQMQPVMQTLMPKMQPDTVMQTQMQLPQMQPVMQMQMKSEVQPDMKLELLQDQPRPLHQMSFTTGMATNAFCPSAG
jgi:hypothetical protein